MADEGTSSKSSHLVKKHHEKAKACHSRPSYRDPRWEKAVKVYTINMESKNILVQGVPSLGVSKDLMDIFSSYGNIESFKKLDDYPTEEFTEVYLIKYARINNARYAKRKMDNKSFFGGVIHVCYAPEFETVDETREKLQERQRVVARKIKELYGNNLEPKTVSPQQPKVIPSSSMSCSSDAASQNIPLTRIFSSGTCTSTRTTEVASCTTNQADDLLCQSNTNYTEFPNIPMPISDIPPPSIPNIPPPPIPLHPSQYPPPPPPWELPRVPSANATLPHGFQNLPNITLKSLHQCPSQFDPTSQPDHLNTGALSASISHPSTGTLVYGPLPASEDPLCEPYHDHTVSKPHRPTVPYEQNLGATNIQASAIECSQHSDNLQTIEASVDRTVLSIREKLKRVSSDSTLQGPSRELSRQRTAKSQPQSKKQRKRI
ncbi:uncharacterized protein LOC116290067 [Actinia tenebrosa]|uniref:RNA-binding protein 48 n=1 Tax=Actinia tenebrosa TaxID=6105 RepID=A0A6P8H910_ACTTE|nr:uncharacterized protein LOC116290067 [Actinia tenebrosa]